MPVKCQMVMDAMDKLAPRQLAESWDNVGLIIGSPAQTVTKILVTLDVTLPVVEEAIAQGAEMIVSHHPLLYKAVNRIRTDLPEGKVLGRLLQAGIAVYAAHTNLDSAPGGVNDLLTEMLKLENTEPLTTSYAEKMYKLAVYVPASHEAAVREAITAAGAGQTSSGKYSHCTFRSEGTGSFLPLTGAQPFIGQTGCLEEVEEYRLETIVGERDYRRVVKALLKAHPYEEPAYDVYPLHQTGTPQGLGRIGRLPEAVSLGEVSRRVKEGLGLPVLTVAGDDSLMIKKVAVCGGSGASLIGKAAFAGADVFITGDVKYHEGQDALAAGLAIIDAGHFATEQPIVAVVASHLRECSAGQKWGVEVRESLVNQDVFRHI